MKYKDITIQENIDLSQYVGMRVGGAAEFYVEVNTREELMHSIEWAQNHHHPVFILGGGSNILVGEAGILGLVVQISIRGREIIFEDDNIVEINIAAGENWDEVVAWAVGNHWWGIENLSHIPGKCGAFVVQNVGAYGQEAAQVVQSVEVYDLQNNEMRILTVDDCKFEYRKSIFNSSEKGRYIILSLTLKLSKNGIPHVKYPDVMKYFEQYGILHPSIHQVREAIISIRDKKLPMPSDIGNNGSFFKNLMLSYEEFDELIQKCSQNFDQDMIDELFYFKEHYNRNGKIKVPTAFLIEKCGLKGGSVGGAQISNQHALVILNPHGNATFDDISQLIYKIRQTVFEKCGVMLEVEPEVIGYDFKI